MDHKLVDRLRRTAAVGLVSILCAGSPAWASDQGPDKSHGDACRQGQAACRADKAKDCHGKSCQSHGNPGGRTVCSTDADCAADEGCRHGRCHKDICTTDADCAASEGCRHGKCHKDVCTTDADCAADEGCRNGKCHKEVCSTDADCDADETCRNGKCHKGGPGDNGKPTDDGGEPTPAEICGDCIDNDGNGLTDLEDPACCNESQTFSLTLSRGVIVPRGDTSKLRLRSILSGAGMTSITPTAQDVLLQLRPADGKDIFCARIPAAAFVQHHNSFKFLARRTPTATAKGLDGVMVNVRHDGTVRFRTRAKNAQITGPEQGSMQLTVGFVNSANPAANRCSSTMSSFQTVRQVTLIAH